MHPSVIAKFMIEIHVKGSVASDFITQLKQVLSGELTEKWGEQVLQFNSELGSGYIRGMSFDWGVSLLDYDVCFNQETKIIIDTQTTSPIEFIFISEGNLQYHAAHLEKHLNLERYQNVIISNVENSEKCFLFPKHSKVRVNFIQILKKVYSKKKNNNISYLTNGLLEAFWTDRDHTNFHHLGGFNLKIADQIARLNQDDNYGIVRSLSLEGRLYLILALQILEHQNFKKNRDLPESLRREDLKKIHELTSFILDYIAEPLTVEVLSKQSGINPKKLQAGFRLLFDKSVNEYIRQLKLEVARDYIKNSDDSISEVVYRIGFKSRSYFSKIFYERYGILPIEYRKQVKANRS